MKASLTTHNLARDAKFASQDACEAVLWQQAVIAVVADGVGTARQGEEAARRAVASLVTNFKSRPLTWSLPRALDEFARLINRSLHQESLARFDHPELLATLAVAVVEGDRLHGLNVGDSRVYLFSNNQLTQLSVDQVDNDPKMRHVLSQAIGMDGQIRPHPFESTVRAGDRVLLCSDGVSNVLPDEELARLMTQSATARTIVTAARELATEETIDDACAVVVSIEELSPGREQLGQLEIPESLQPGMIVDGCELLSATNQNERTWIAARGDTRVVIKFPPLEAVHNESIRQQFQREIWSLTRLQADYFTRAFVPDGGTAFCYCMEYVEAPNLKDTLAREGPLTVEETVALAMFLLDACQYLLQFDLVHGDVKPENILVLRRGSSARFKLIDFGSISEVFSVTSRAGTPSYLAPERFGGTPISEGTEVFALGVTLYESLTRQVPYGEIEPFQTPSFRPPKPPSKLNRLVPPWLDALILRSIAVTADDRLQNYSELKFGLEHPDKVKPFFKRDAPLIERNPVLFYQLAGAVLLLGNLILLYLLFRKP